MAVQFHKPALKSEPPARTVERRHGRRFPLTMTLQFRQVSRNEAWKMGSSLNFSNSGVLLWTERPPPLGASIELVVDWPAKSGASPKRELVVVGMVIRLRGNEVAVSIRTFAFRNSASQTSAAVA